MEVDPDDWENIINLDYKVVGGGSVNQGASDNIINLLTDITMEDQTSTLHNTFVVDVGKSSTGSTADDGHENIQGHTKTNKNNVSNANNTQPNMVGNILGGTSCCTRIILKFKMNVQ